MGGLLLFIIAEILLRVLVAAQTRVQAYGHILAGVVVLHGHLPVTLVDGPEVCLQKLAVQAQRVGLGGLAQFLLPRGLLANGAVIHIVDGLVQLAAFLAQALGAVLRGVVVLEHLAVGRIPGQNRRAAVLLRHKEAELHGLRCAVRLGQTHRGGRAAVGVLVLQFVDGRGQPGLLLGGQVAGQRGRFPQCAADSLPHDNGADARHRLAERLCNGQVLLARSGHDGGGARLQKVRPRGLGRQRVGQTRQQLADLAVVKVHPLEGINDAPALHEHQIGVAAHQLDGQRIRDQVAHLVRAAEVKIDDAVPRLAAQLNEPPAGQVLAQQHTEARRRERVLEALLRQADAGRAAAGRQQQAVGLGAGAQGHKHLVAGRLKNFVDLGIEQRVFQFTGDQRQRCGIKGHGNGSLL